MKRDGCEEINPIQFPHKRYGSKSPENVTAAANLNDLGERTNVVGINCAKDFINQAIEQQHSRFIP